MYTYGVMHSNKLSEISSKRISSADVEFLTESLIPYGK
jgi:hypothetical protein